MMGGSQGAGNSFKPLWVNLFTVKRVNTMVGFNLANRRHTLYHYRNHKLMDTRCERYLICAALAHRLCPEFQI
jgi:hypothetical protein